MPGKKLVLLVTFGVWLTHDTAGAAPIEPFLLEAPCPGPNCTAEIDTEEPASQGLRVVYLNFDGVTLTASTSNDDARQNVSAILSNAAPIGGTLSIPPFESNELWSSEGLSREQLIQRVVDDLYAIHAPYNVKFVTERPESGNYHMVVFGGTCGSVTGQNGCAGIALLDCGDYMPNNIVFVFPRNLRVADLATTAAHETAHALGLSHTLDKTDVMYPQVQNDIIPHHFGAGAIPQGDATCGNATFQDSHETMMTTIGYRGQDTIPPVVTIREPGQGAMVAPGSMVRADATDDNLVVRGELHVNGELIASQNGAGPFEFQIPDSIASGDVMITVRAFDDSQNMGFDRIIGYALSGEELTCDAEGRCPEGYLCLEDHCIPDNELRGSLGATCEQNGDCLSGMCASADGESLCSQACNADSPCPNGFECRGDVACWPASGGCSLAGSRGGASGAFLLALALLATGRRSRRSR